MKTRVETIKKQLKAFNLIDKIVLVRTEYQLQLYSQPQVFGIYYL